MRFNPVQSVINSNLNREVVNEMEDLIGSVVFLSNLVDKGRKTAKECDHDEKGKVIVDLSNPHILENMDYFRQTAIHFEKYNAYTLLAPNPSPNSDYYKFWKEEVRRCREGLVRESDGEWIPGSYYYYLNYSPIQKSKTKKDSKEAYRVQGFPDVYDGDYLFYHYCRQARIEGAHAGMLKKRSAGFSYKVGAELGRLLKIGDTAETRKYLNAFAIASEGEYLMKDGVLSKFIENADWTDHHTPWPNLKLVSSKAKMIWKMGYRTKDNRTEGTLNSVIGVTTKGDPDKARGKRGPIFWDEWGKFPNLLKSWEVARHSVSEGEYSFAQMCGGGTGGASSANFEGAEELFYNPKGYEIHGVPNVYDRNTDGSGLCGFFFGAYLNRKGCYDNNGNSNIIKALTEILKRRIEIKYNSSDPNTLVQHRAEMPCVPQDAVLRREGSIFPVADLKDHLAQVSPNIVKFTAPHYIGHLKHTASGKVEWDKLQLHSVLRDYPLKKDTTDLYGCVEIYQMPKRGKDGTVPRGRYIAGCLPTGEKVLTGKGLVNIENITYNDKLVSKYGDLVDIKKLMDFDVKEFLYEIKVGNTFRTTKFTGEHPLYVSDRKWGYRSQPVSKRLGLPNKYKKFDFDFKEVEKVKEGQWIKVPNVYKKLENHFDLDTLWNDGGYRIDRCISSPLKNKDFWWFVGVWLGDGWCQGGSRISVSFNGDELEYIGRFKKIVKDLFQRDSHERKRNGAVEITFGFQQLNRFLNKYFGKYAYGKYLSEWVKKIDKDFKYELLSGYLASDGCIGKDKIKYWYTEFVSINLRLLEDFQDVLFSIGLISSIRRLRAAGMHVINGKHSKVVETYRLSLSHYDTMTFAKVLYESDKIKIKRISKKELQLFNGRRYSVDCEFSKDKNYIYFKIKSIKRSLYDGRVYNFECDTNTYLCHHITTHNCDPIDYDVSTYAHSLGSVFIMDLLLDKIVAEYTGRPPRASEFYEQTLRLLKLYNAEANYENNLKGLYSYFEQKHALQYLCDTPEVLRDMELVKGTFYGNRSKGTSANKAINGWGRKLQADWMISDAYDIENVEEVDDEGNPIEKPKILNLQKIRSVGYLKEAVAWNPDDNFDRVSAMGMLMILREDKLKFEKKRFTEEHDALFDDPWFDRFGKFTSLKKQKKRLRYSSRKYPVKF